MYTSIIFFAHHFLSIKSPIKKRFPYSYENNCLGCFFYFPISSITFFSVTRYFSAFHFHKRQDMISTITVYTFLSLLQTILIDTLYYRGQMVLFILFSAILKYHSSFSMPIKFLFRFLQATPVVPDPIVKSRTVSHSLV